MSELKVFRLENDAGLRVELLNFGARITRIVVPDREGRPEDVVLGFEQAGEYLNDNPAYGAICGRVANRIAHGRFELDGREVRLACNLGAHHLHGGRIGWDRRYWTCVGVDRRAAQLRYESPAGEEGYPGRVVCDLLYQLLEDGTLRIDYSALTDAPTPLNLTNHAYFNLAGAGTEHDLAGHELTIHADRYTPVDSEGIPTGEIVAVAGTVLDFRRPRGVLDRIDHSDLRERGGYDHNFVLNDFPSDAVDATAPVLRPAARLVHTESGRRLDVATTEPGLQLYTGNFLGGPGKGGGSYRPYAGLCLECQHFPDAINQPTFPSIIVRPGASYRQISEYRFGLV